MRAIEGTSVIEFRINPNLDLESLARAYAADGRVRVYSLLANDDVAALLDDLAARDDWWHLINTPDGMIELDRAARARMSAKRRAGPRQRGSRPRPHWIPVPL